MKIHIFFNIHSLRIVTFSASIAVLYGCSSVPISDPMSGKLSGGISKTAPLTADMRNTLHGDFKGIYTAWILPQFVRGEMNVVKSEDQFASEKTIADGFAELCADIGGKSEVQPLKYGHKNICNSATGEYIGEFVTERYESGLRVTFDSRAQRELNQRLQEAKIEAQNKRDYQSLSSDTLSIEQLQSLIARFQNNDPERLIPHAKAKLSALLAEQKKQSEMEAIRQAKERQQEAVIQATEQRQLAAYRKSLAEGEETSCGLVIEKKAKLVKIQMKSSNAEQWVKLEEIYPVGQICSLAVANTASSIPSAMGTTTTSLLTPVHACPDLRNDQTIKMEQFISDFESVCRGGGGRVTHGNLQFQCSLRVTAYLIYFKRDDLCRIRVMNKSSLGDLEVQQTRGVFD